MNLNLQKLNNEIIKCRKCPRLIKYQKVISLKKRKQFIHENYLAKPIKQII